MEARFWCLEIKGLVADKAQVLQSNGSGPPIMIARRQRRQVAVNEIHNSLEFDVETPTVAGKPQAS
jgi:hypothetical protein